MFVQIESFFCVPLILAYVAQKLLNVDVASLLPRVSIPFIHHHLTHPHVVHLLIRRRACPEKGVEQGLGHGEVLIVARQGDIADGPMFHRKIPSSVGRSWRLCVRRLVRHVLNQHTLTFQERGRFGLEDFLHRPRPGTLGQDLNSIRPRVENDERAVGGYFKT